MQAAELKPPQVDSPPFADTVAAAVFSTTIPGRSGLPPIWFQGYLDYKHVVTFHFYFGYIYLSITDMTVPDLYLSVAGVAPA